MPINYSRKNQVTLFRFKNFQQKTDANFKEVGTSIRGIIKILDQHSKVLDQHSKILERHSKILNQHTRTLLSIEQTIKIYGDMYQLNKENIEKLTKNLALS